MYYTFCTVAEGRMQKNANQSNNHSEFETSGAYPYNPVKTPEEAFLISDAVL
jgi:hypothetical protein